MGIIDNAKELASLVQKIGQIEIYERVVALQGQIVDLSTQKLELAEENARLKQALSLREEMQFENPYYLREGWPHCPNCYDTTGRAVRLTDIRPRERGFLIFCTNCKSSFETETLPAGVAARPIHTTVRRRGYTD